MNAAVFAALVAAVPLAICLLVGLYFEGRENQEKREKGEKGAE